MSRQYLTSRQLAQLVGVSLNTIYRWLKAGKIPEPYRNPDNNYRLWTSGDVQQIRYVLLRSHEEAEKPRSRRGAKS
ncbi:helix-turn-helix domain-containing protein [Nostoc sp. NIES-2111]